MANENIVGKLVFCKRNGATGTVAIQDAQTITIVIEGIEKSYTYSTFKRWWTVIPEEQTEEEIKAAKEEEVEQGDSSLIEPDKFLAGAKGIGVELRDKFIQLIKDLEIDEVIIFHNEKSNSDVVKYKGVNVFECTYASKRFNVLAHPDSLSPTNKKKVTKMHPREWGWSLRAKFVFTELTQWPLMKSIISDGLFYRRDGITKD